MRKILILVALISVLGTVPVSFAQDGVRTCYDFEQKVGGISVLDSFFAIGQRLGMTLEKSICKLRMASPAVSDEKMTQPASSRKLRVVVVEGCETYPDCKVIQDTSAPQSSVAK